MFQRKYFVHLAQLTGSTLQIFFGLFIFKREVQNFERNWENSVYIRAR